MLWEFSLRIGGFNAATLLGSSMTYFKERIYDILENPVKYFWYKNKMKNIRTRISFSTPSKLKLFPCFISNQPMRITKHAYTHICTYVFIFECIHLCVKVNAANCNCMLAREIHITAGRNLKKILIFSGHQVLPPPHTRVPQRKTTSK